MNCELCPQPLYSRHKGYFAGLYFRPAHIKCIKQLEHEEETLKREANLQRVKQNQELRLYQIRRLLIDDFHKKNR